MTGGDDMTLDKIRWGILSTGDIAQRFAEALKGMPDADLIAVGSRRQATADVFGSRFGIAKCHPSYQALANDLPGTRQ
jgi:predicted dehydrogenase